MLSRWKTLTLTAAALLMTGPNLWAQDDRSFCEELFPGLKVGDYAVWAFTQAGRTMQMTIGVVDEEDWEGEPHIWVEMAVEIPGMGKMISQQLVPDYPYSQNDIKAFIAQMPGQAPMKMPPNASEIPTEDWRAECLDMTNEYLGMESVAVEGVGTFNAHHFRQTGPDGGDGYFSHELPFALVKLEFAEGGMQLIAVGDDYKGSIDRSTVQ
jgi:hypothetical protein